MELTEDAAASKVWKMRYSTGVIYAEESLMAMDAEGLLHPPNSLPTAFTSPLAERDELAVGEQSQEPPETPSAEGYREYAEDSLELAEANLAAAVEALPPE